MLLQETMLGNTLLSVVCASCFQEVVLGTTSLNVVST